VVDWVMRRTVEHAGTGITTTLEDLNFADSLALISSTFTHIQMKNDQLNRNRKGMGLKISTKKTKLMSEDQYKDQQCSCSRWKGNGRRGWL